MNKVIIFEGPDKSGKTTIAKELAKRYNISYFKNYSEQSNFVDKSFTQSAFIEANYLINILNQVEIKNNTIILDRHMPSEYAYSKTFGRKTNESLIWEYDEKFLKYSTVIIYCYKNDYSEYTDEVVDMNQVNKLKKYYDEYLDKTKLKTLKLETSNEDLSSQINEIHKFIGWLK